jgi:hypothetical protein
MRSRRTNRYYIHVLDMLRVFHANVSKVYLNFFDVANKYF